MYLKRFLNLKEKPLNSNDTLLAEEKANILKFISSSIKRNVSSIKKIIFATKSKFGNILICLNKIIFFCEILGCKEIYLPKQNYWFIQNPIILKDYNISLNLININEPKYSRYIDNNYSDIIYYNFFHPFYYCIK